MKKAILAAICCMLGCMGLSAQTVPAGYTDVTATYLSNPEFDSLNGWTRSFSGGTYKVSTGQKGDGSVITATNHLQVWNANPLTGTVYQTLSNLPRGRYILQAGAYNEFTGRVYLFAGSQEADFTNKSNQYLNTPAAFVANDNGTLKVGFGISTTSGYSDIEIDHFKLYYKAETRDFTAIIDALSSLSRLVESNPWNTTLASVLATAQAVYDNDDSTQEQLDAQVSAINTAIGNAYADASDANPLVLSHLIANNSFANKLDSWTLTSNTSGYRDNKPGSDAAGSFYNFWSANVDYYDISQTISGLPDGTYVLSVKMMSAKSTGTLGSRPYGSFVYAESDGCTSISANEPKQWETFTEVSTRINVSGGSLKIGARLDNAFAKMRDFSLSKVTTAPNSAEVANGMARHTAWENYTANAIDLRTGHDNMSSLPAADILAPLANPNALVFANAGQIAVGDESNIVIGGTCSSLLLADKKDFVPLAGFTATSATYSTSITDAGYATLTLPFTYNVPEGLTAFTLDGMSDATRISATAVTTVSANTPVLIKGEAGEYTFTADNVSVVRNSAPSDGLLVGTYTAISSVPTGAYLLQNHDGEVAFYVVPNDATLGLKAFRAYLNKSNSEAKTLTIDFVNPTGIRDDVSGSAKCSGMGSLYNLAGQRVSPGTKGIIILNGKKIWVR